MSAPSRKWFRFRIATLLAMFLVLFCVLVFRAFHLQIMTGKTYKNLAEQQHKKALQLHPERGIIFDRNGEKLAASILADSVFADPSKIDNVDEAAAQLAAVAHFWLARTYQAQGRYAEALAEFEAAGPALGGWIGDHFGLRSIYLVSFFVFILSTLVVIWIRPAQTSPQNLAGSLPRLHRNSRFLALLPFFFLTTLATYLPQTLTPNYLQNQQGLDFSQIGQLGSIGSFGIVVALLALGSLAPWIGLMVGQLSINLFALMLWHGSGFGWL